MNNKFRLEGVGRMHDRGIKDIIATLRAANEKAPIKKRSLYVIGHSRGGHMAGLLATRLSEHTKDFEISRTVVIDAGMNRVDDYFRQFTKMEGGIRKDSLNFVDNDWTHGPLCYRPEGKLTDNEWEQVKKLEDEHFSRYRKNFAIKEPYKRTEAYFNQSPYHHADKLQGRVLILPDKRRYAYPSAIQFQNRVGLGRVTVSGHMFGHGFDTDDENAMTFYFEQLRNFFDLGKQ